MHNELITIHEASDMEHLLLVPFVVNDTFGHCGGISEFNKGAFTPSTGEEAESQDSSKDLSIADVDNGVKNGVKGFASKYKYQNDIDRRNASTTGNVASGMTDSGGTS